MPNLPGVILANDPAALPRNCNCDRMQKAVSRSRARVICKKDRDTSTFSAMADGQIERAEKSA